MNGNSKLFGSANWIIVLGIIGVLIAAQWKHETLPTSALAVILLLVIAKARLIILDFMFLRGTRPLLAVALVSWTVFFAFAGLARAMLPMSGW